MYQFALAIRAGGHMEKYIRVLAEILDDEDTSKLSKLVKLLGIEFSYKEVDEREDAKLILTKDDQLKHYKFNLQFGICRLEGFVSCDVNSSKKNLKLHLLRSVLKYLVDLSEFPDLEAMLTHLGIVDHRLIKYLSDTFPNVKKASILFMKFLCECEDKYPKIKKIAME
jgi:hypothetical protein